MADFYRVRRPRGCLIAKLQNTKYSKSSCKQVINWRPTVNDFEIHREVTLKGSKLWHLELLNNSFQRVA